MFLVLVFAFGGGFYFVATYDLSTGTAYLLGGVVVVLLDVPMSHLRTWERGWPFDD